MAEKLLPVGGTDAEIAYNFIKFLMNVRTQAEKDYSRARDKLLARGDDLMVLEMRLKIAEAQKPTLEDISEQIRRISERLGV